MGSKYKNQCSIIFAGHFAIDNIIQHNKDYKLNLGGSVSYCSLALRTYTKDAKIRIISHIGRRNINDSLLDIIKNKNLDLKGIKYSDVNNTNFVLEYLNHSRTLTLRSRSPDLRFDDIPIEYQDEPPDIIVLVPLCNEISYAYITQIIEHFPTSYIGIDLQGFIRKFDEHGKVSYVNDENVILNIRNIINLIGNKLILKGSEEEMKLLAGEYKDLVKVMNHFNDYDNDGIYIMTLGDKGSMLIKKGKTILNIPAFKPNEVVDETGAGDVYFSIFLYEFIQSDKSWEIVKKIAYIASAAASFLVEKKGPKGFETKEKVLDRLKTKNYIK